MWFEQWAGLLIDRSGHSFSSVWKFGAPGVAASVLANSRDTARQSAGSLPRNRVVAPRLASMLSHSVFSSSFSPCCRENRRVSDFEVRTAARTTLVRVVHGRPDQTLPTRVKPPNKQEGRKKNSALIVKVDPVFQPWNPIGEEQLLRRNFPRFRSTERYVDSPSKLLSVRFQFSHSPLFTFELGTNYELDSSRFFGMAYAIQKF